MHHHHGSQCVVENRHDYRQVPFDLVGSVVKDGILPQKIVADASSRKKKKARPRRHGGTGRGFDAFCSALPQPHPRGAGVREPSSGQAQCPDRAASAAHLQLFPPRPPGGGGDFWGFGVEFRYAGVCERVSEQRRGIVVEGRQCPAQRMAKPCGHVMSCNLKT